jgi:hypothetical protein
MQTERDYALLGLELEWNMPQKHTVYQKSAL